MPRLSESLAITSGKPCTLMLTFNVSLKEIHHILAQRWLAVLSALVIGYLTLCHLLRYRRLNAMRERYKQYADRSSLSKMTGDDAQKIMMYLFELEFPAAFSISLGFALFRTYGIPSISGLLSQTKALVGPGSHISKRTADTAALICEIALNPPSTPRSITALSRLNYIHNTYINKGKISNDDMLYTLSRFVLEPIEWIAKYEWRQLDDFEKGALAFLWMEIGLGMGISYEVLEVGCERQRGRKWRDALEWLETLKLWSEEYEKKSMVPAKENRIISESLLKYRQEPLPDWAKPYLEKIFMAVIDDRLRESIMFDKPPQLYFTFVSVFGRVRKFWLRHLSLPRPYWRRGQFISDDVDPKTGRYYFVRWARYPWYIRPQDRIKRGLLGSRRKLVDNDPTKYRPEGYLIEELGPDYMKGKGLEEMEKNQEVLRRQDRGGCPFTFE
ncbi:hypothetical protein F5884DRAFT_278691 [Xylogone sp. PMI_703]|nr:hypothetical protein F5884DRAFT_278691 [Xylogone sp. PMI_703]